MVIKIDELPTGNFTILCLAAVVCVVLAIACFVAHHQDKKEIDTVADVIYFQDAIPVKDPVYILTLRMDRCYAYSGWTDLIVRLRGSKKDSPVILFRDFDGRYLADDKILNIGFSIPFELGTLVEVDIAGDNNKFHEGYSVFTFSELFIRKLPRKADALANSKTRMMLESGKSPFDALSKNVKTWASVEMMANSPGANVLGVSVPGAGGSRTVRARGPGVCLHLQEEEETLKKKARIGFRPQHYIWSQSSSWHEPWSEYSRLDQDMVICLDLIATLVAVSSCYAYGVERLLGAEMIAGMFLPMEEDIKDSAKNVQEFDLMDALSNYHKYLIPLVLMAYVALLSSAFVIPLSLLWCRLFRLIGGKGFEFALEGAQPPPPHEKSFLPPVPRARRHEHIEDDWLQDDFFDDANCLMLRTLECKSRHTASCVTSSRRLRVEPLLTNCSADHITARSIAYIRTKMTKLRDDDLLSGQAGLKHPEVLHESHTESTDAPKMPPPPTAPDGSGEVVRVSRYCERLVQQAVRQINDNSVIAECFEVAPHASSARGVHSKKDKFANCCQNRCCGMTGNPNESISNLTFFTEEDAVSLQEMCDHLPTPRPSEQKFSKISPRPPARATFSGRELNSISSNTEQVSTGAPSFPEPSANRRRSSLKKFSLKNLKGSMTKKVDIPLEEDKLRKTRKRVRKQGLRVLPPFSTDSESSEGKIYRHSREKTKKKGVRFSFEKEGKGEKAKDGSRSKTKSSRDSGKVAKEKKSSKKVLKKFHERTRSSRPFTPFPSAKSDVIHDPVAVSNQNYDWASAKAPLPDAPDQDLAKSAPLKGHSVKLCVFAFLLLLQLGEIYFVTAFEMEQNKFFLRNVDKSSGPGASRMNCALVSSLIALLWYPLFSVHMIAIFSFLVEKIRLQMSQKQEAYQEGGSVIERPSLTAFP